jgi:hypothetical protein
MKQSNCTACSGNQNEACYGMHLSQICACILFHCHGLHGHKTEPLVRTRTLWCASTKILMNEESSLAERHKEWTCSSCKVDNLTWWLQEILVWGGRSYMWAFRGANDQTAAAQTWGTVPHIICLFVWSLTAVDREKGMIGKMETKGASPMKLTRVSIRYCQGITHAQNEICCGQHGRLPLLKTLTTSGFPTLAPHSPHVHSFLSDLRLWGRVILWYNKHILVLVPICRHSTDLLKPLQFPETLEQRGIFCYPPAPFSHTWAYNDMHTPGGLLVSFKMAQLCDLRVRTFHSQGWERRESLSSDVNDYFNHAT